MNSRIFTILLVLLLPTQIVRADGPPEWNKEKAAAILDQRTKDWFDFDSAERGEGASKSSCVCCHTVLTYSLARPIVRKSLGKAEPSEIESRLLKQTKMRTAHWNELDTDAFGLWYDFSKKKPKESWGTEAVINAAILSFDDHYQGRKTPSAEARKAFANLWKVQVATGDEKGSFEWLDFDFEPWESKDSRYYGVALAAIAVGRAPGYYAKGVDAELDANVESLRGWLKKRFAGQSLHNRMWGLWAEAQLGGILTDEQRTQTIGELLAKQRDDGGWSLASLGKYVRTDGTAQDENSDACASGMVLHVLQTAVIGKDDGKIAKGLNWLRANQEKTGEWRSLSLNRRRDRDSHSGRFMSNAATAFAVLALSH